MTAEKLKDIIATAFAGATLSEGVSLHQVNILDA